MKGKIVPFANSQPNQPPDVCLNKNLRVPLGFSAFFFVRTVQFSSILSFFLVSKNSHLRVEFLLKTFYFLSPIDVFFLDFGATEFNTLQETCFDIVNH